MQNCFIMITNFKKIITTFIEKPLCQNYSGFYCYLSNIANNITKLQKLERKYPNWKDLLLFDSKNYFVWPKISYKNITSSLKRVSIKLFGKT